MNLVVEENLTSLTPMNVHISQANSSSIIQPVSQPILHAIQKQVNGASLSSLDLRIKISNASASWTLVENYTITIGGINTNSGSSITSNLAFTQMNVTEPLTYGGMELNSIGPSVILPALVSKSAGFPSPCKYCYWIDGSNPQTAVIPERTTQEFSLFDFTWIPVVSTWTGILNILGQATAWSYDPQFPRYNLTIGGVPSPEGGLLHSYAVVYNPSMIVTVPANAWADGDNVHFDVPTSSEAIMPIIIFASILVAAAAFVLDRKLSGPLRVRRKR